MLEGCVLVRSCCELELWQCAWVNLRLTCSNADELATHSGSQVGAGALYASSERWRMHVRRAGAAGHGGVLCAWPVRFFPPGFFRQHKTTLSYLTLMSFLCRITQGDGR